jgi:hypothetical protein
MTTLTHRADYVFRPTRADNTPRGADMGEARTWGTEIESLVLAVASSGGALAFDTRANLFADLARGASTQAWVLTDPTAAYNGIYRKIGASGSGSWSRLGDLPYSYIAATNTGGTAAVIAASTAIPLPVTDAGALIALPIAVTTTVSPVSVSFNGGDALRIKTASGADVPIGGLPAGMLVAGYKNGTTFQLLTDIASAAIQAAAEAAQAAAEAAAAGAAGTIPAVNRAAIASLNPTNVKTAFLFGEGGRNGLFSWSAANLSTKVTNDPGQGVYIPPASDATGASGAWVRQRQLRTYDVEWFGCSASAADNHQAVTNCITLAKHEGGGTILVPQFYQTATLIVFDGADLNVVGTSRSAGFYRTTAGATVEFTGQRHRASDLLIAMQVMTTTVTDFALWIHDCVECHFERIRISGGYNCISITGGVCSGNTFYKCSLSFATGPAMLALADSTGGVNGAHHFYACELNQGYPVSFPNGTTTFKGARANGTAYAVGDIVVVGQFNLQCRVAGTSAGSAPTVNVWYGVDIADGATLKWRLVANANYRGIDVGTGIYYSVWRECDLTGPFIHCIHVRNQFALVEPNTLLFDHCTTHGPISNAYYLEDGNDILISNPNGWNAFDNIGTTYGVLNSGCRDVRVTNPTLYGFDVGVQISNGGTDVVGGTVTGCGTGVSVAPGIVGWSVHGVNLGFTTLGGANTTAMTIGLAANHFSVVNNRTYGAAGGIVDSSGAVSDKVVSGNIN